MGVKIKVTGYTLYTYKEIPRFPTVEERERLKFAEVYANIPELEKDLFRLLRSARSFQDEGEIVLKIDPFKVREIKNGALFYDSPMDKRKHLR